MAVTTVAQFAAELNRPATTLLEQLKSAGVAKQSPEDSLADSDKERLLDFLRISHGTAEQRAPQDHAHQEVHHRDQAGRCLGQGTHDPGRSAQEACLRQARRARCARRGSGRQGRGDRRGRAQSPRRRSQSPSRTAAPPGRRAGREAPPARGSRSACSRGSRSPCPGGRREGCAGSRGEGCGRSRRTRNRDREGARYGRGRGRGRCLRRRRPPRPLRRQPLHPRQPSHHPRATCE